MQSNRIYWPFAVLVSIALIYTFVWFYLAERTEQDFNHWIELQKSHGTEVKYTDLKVGGYPYRLTIRLKNPEIFAQDHPNQWYWHSEELIATAHTYNPNHIMIELKGEQSFRGVKNQHLSSTDPFSWTTSVTADVILVSLRLKSGKISHIDSDFQNLIAENSQSGSNVGSEWRHFFDGTVSMNRFEIHSRLRSEESLFAQDIAIIAQGVKTEDTPASGFENQMDAFVIDATLTDLTEVPLHEGRIGVAPDLHNDELKTAIVHNIQAVWLPVSISGQGAITYSDNGPEDGEIDLSIVGYEDLLRALQRENEIDRTTAALSGAVLGALSVLTGGGDDEIQLPLRFDRGQVFLGFIPLSE